MKFSKVVENLSSLKYINNLFSSGDNRFRGTMRIHPIGGKFCLTESMNIYEHTVSTSLQSSIYLINVCTLKYEIIVHTQRAKPQITFNNVLINTSA